MTVLPHGLERLGGKGIDSFFDAKVTNIPVVEGKTLNWRMHRFGMRDKIDYSRCCLSGID
jgi:hypothetical protein